MKISNTCKQLIIIMISLSFICLGIGLFLTKNIKGLFLGYLLGTIFSVLKLILLEKTLERAVSMDRNKAIGYTRLHYCFRYFLTIIVIVVAGLSKGDISLVGVLVSLILLRPAIFIVRLKDKENKI